MIRYVKHSFIVLPLLYACGGKDKDRDRVVEPPFPQEKPAEPLELTDEELGDQIRIQAHHRGLAHYGFLIGYHEHQLVPIYNGKTKRVIEQQDLRKEGIRKVEDAFKNLDWIKTHPFELVAESIRAHAYEKNLITAEQYSIYRAEHKVPIYQEETNFVIFEKDMLAWWILERKDAFPAQ